MDMGKGDIPRLQYILETLKEGKSLFSSDKKYVEDLISKYIPQEKPQPKSENSEKGGEDIPKKLFPERVEYKSESITLIFAIIVSLFGFMGVGHMYLGKVKKGIVILVLGLVKSVAGILLLIGGLAFLGQNSVSSKVYEPLGSSHIDPTTGIIILAIGIGLLIGVIVLFFWQILDARKLCRKYNEYVTEHGKRPW